MSLKFLSPMTLSLNLGSMFQLYVGTASSMLILPNSATNISKSTLTQFWERSLKILCQ